MPKTSRIKPATPATPTTPEKPKQPNIRVPVATYNTVVAKAKKDKAQIGVTAAKYIDLGIKAEKGGAK